MRPRRTTPVLAALGAVAVAGCGSSPEAAPAPEAAPPELAVSLDQLRSGLTSREMHVRVENEGTATVDVLSLQLVAPELEPVAPVDQDATFDPGRRFDLPVPYGPVRCDAGDGATQVVLQVSVDGTEREVVADVPRPNEALERVVEDECRAQALAEVVAIELVARPPAVDGSLPAVLRVRRTGGSADVVVREVRGSVLYRLRPASTDPVAALPPGADQVEVPVAVEPGRCDPHAFIESKRSFLLPVWVSLDGAEDASTTITVAEDSRTVMNDFALRACGLTG